MEMIDHPRLADCPQSFRVACARLMLIWFWASWPEQPLGAVGTQHVDEDKNREHDGRNGYGGAGGHAAAADDGLAVARGVTASRSLTPTLPRVASTIFTASGRDGLR